MPTSDLLISSPANSQVKFVRSLLEQKRARYHAGLFVLEGVRLVEEALRWGRGLELVLFSQDLLTTERGRELQAAAQSNGARTVEVASQVLERLSSTVTPQGVLAVHTMLSWSPQPNPRLTVYLDALQDPGNLGTILRTCEAAGVDQVILGPGTVDLYNPKVVRAAMGAHFRLPSYEASPDHLVERLAGVPFYLATAQGGRPYTEVDWRLPAVLIIGNEGHGPGLGARAVATAPVHIPMAQPVDSLNAATATAIILFEARRQRGIL
ncbi:MAG: RNA methyltransferase [Chloroflexi bacterium]|nr:RNA methyltransferase [Chloroflexota bacterium]